MDKLAHIGEYYQEQDKFIFSNHAFRVRYAYFDSTRDLGDATPHTLLVRLADNYKLDPDIQEKQVAQKTQSKKQQTSGTIPKKSTTVRKKRK